MNSKRLTAIAAIVIMPVALALSLPASTGFEPDASGFKLSDPDGIEMNGQTYNGVRYNGRGLNGRGLNGRGLNGKGCNGIDVSGNETSLQGLMVLGIELPQR